MTAEGVEGILLSVLRQYGLSFRVQQVAVDGHDWTVVLTEQGSVTRLTGALGSPSAVRAALMKALDVAQP